MGRRIACIAAVLSICTTLVGVASAASSVVGAEGSKRAATRLREVPTPLLYDGDPSDVIRAENRMEKRALDSRNCGTFNMGKKFGRFSWLRSADSTWRRLQYELGGHRWERGVEAGGGMWRDDDDEGGPLSTREDKRPLQESEPNDELQILRVD